MIIIGHLYHVGYEFVTLHEMTRTELLAKQSWFM